MAQKNAVGSGSKREKGLMMGTIIYFMGTVSTSLLQFLFVPIITALLAADSYAYYDLVINAIFVIMPILTLQALEALFRMMVDAKEEKRPAYVSTVGMICLGSIGAFGLLLIVGVRLFDFIHYPWLLFWYYVGVVSHQFYQRVARSLAKNKLYVGMGVLQTVLALGLQLVLLLQFNLGVEAMFIAGAVAMITVAVIYELVLKLRRYVSVRQITAAARKEILRFSIPLLPDQISWWAVSQISRYIMVGVLGLAAVGVYNMAFKFGVVVSMVTNVFQLAWQESAIRESGAEDRNDYYNQTFDSYMRFVMSMVALLIPITPFVLPFMLNNEYYSASAYVPWIYVVAAFEAFMLFMSTGYIVSKKTMGASVTMIIGSVFSVVFTLVFIRALGVYAVLLSSILAYALVWVLRIRGVRDVMPITVHKPTFLLLLLWVGASIAAYYLLPQWAMWPVLAASIGICLVANRVLVRMVWQGVRDVVKKK